MDYYMYQFDPFASETEESLEIEEEDEDYDSDEYNYNKINCSSKKKSSVKLAQPSIKKASILRKNTAIFDFYKGSTKCIDSIDNKKVVKYVSRDSYQDDKNVTTSNFVRNNSRESSYATILSTNPLNRKSLHHYTNIRTVNNSSRSARNIKVRNNSIKSVKNIRKSIASQISGKNFNDGSLEIKIKEFINNGNRRRDSRISGNTDHLFDVYIDFDIMKNFKYYFPHNNSDKICPKKISIIGGNIQFLSKKNQ